MLLEPRVIKTLSSSNREPLYLILLLLPPPQTEFYSGQDEASTRQLNVGELISSFPLSVQHIIMSYTVTPAL